MPSTVRQTPTQPWIPRVPATPTHQRFNQPISTPSGAFLSSNTTLHPSSIFANMKQPPQTPSSNHSQLTNQDLARKAIAASSAFPNTTEGHAAYLTALQAWEAVYPQREKLISRQHHIPLHQVQLHWALGNTTLAEYMATSRRNMTQRYPK